MAKLNCYDPALYGTYREPTAFNKLMVAAQGLDQLYRKEGVGLDPWYAYLDAYDTWIEETLAEELS